MKNSITISYPPKINSKTLIEQLKRKVTSSKRTLKKRKEIEAFKWKLELTVLACFLMLHFIAGIIYFLVLKGALVVL